MENGCQPGLERRSRKRPSRVTSATVAAETSVGRGQLPGQAQVGHAAPTLGVRGLKATSARLEPRLGLFLLSPIVLDPEPADQRGQSEPLPDNRRFHHRLSLSHRQPPRARSTLRRPYFSRRSSARCFSISSVGQSFSISAFSSAPMRTARAVT
jgi:hypothetical protein